MEKDIKSKVIYAIVLVVVFIGAAQLLYNAIEMMNFTSFGEYTYGSLQKPLAIISFIAAFVAFVGVAAGVTSFCVKKKTVKTICHAFIFAAAVVMLVLIIVSTNVWLNHYKEEYSDYGNPPYDITIRNNTSVEFALYSGVMSMLVPQLAYFVVLAAVQIWEFVKSLKKKKSIVQTEEKDGVATEEVQ